MSKKRNAANISAGLYDGDFQLSFDCGGSDNCKHARFYAEPPEPDEECAFRTPGGNCTHGPAQREALIAMRDQIVDQVNLFEDGGEA